MLPATGYESSGSDGAGKYFSGYRPDIHVFSKEKRAIRNNSLPERPVRPHVIYRERHPVIDGKPKYFLIYHRVII